MFRNLTMLVLVVASFAGGTFAAPPTSLPIRSLTVLGDSFSDQGNLFAATSFLGAGVGLPGLPDAQHYFHGRFSNGPNYVDFLAQKFGFAMTPSIGGGSNFAYGGARTTYNIVELPSPPSFPGYPVDAFPWALDDETEAFLEQAPSKAADPTALFVVFSGANDLADVFLLHHDPAATIATTVEGIRQAILAFQAAGGRTVLVPNVPNLGVIPLVTRNGPGVSLAARNLSLAYNVALAKMLDTIVGIDIVRFDTFEFITDVVANPSKYGFTNATQPCYSGFVTPDPTATECSDPDAHVFWDGEHPTTKLHAVIADLLYESVLLCQSRGGATAGTTASDRARFVSRCNVSAH